jgi:dTDP-4-dehydrorhamnose 3,5-epimerase
MDFNKGKISGVILIQLAKFIDERGFLVETFRSDQLQSRLLPAMSYVSYTEPGIGRGPHEHKEQTDIFSFIGPANFKIYLWDIRTGSDTSGVRQIVFCGADNPVTLIVPPGVIHAYKNISRNERGMVINYPDKLYAGEGKKSKVDEIRHEDEHDMFYKEFMSL